MSGEDRQRTMDFILDQQAQFATNIQLLRETQTQLLISQAKSEARLDRIEEIVLRTVGVVERLANSLERTEGAVAALAEAHARLAGGQEHTDERLSSLINLVERYISQGTEGDSA